mmetsp:Transcript_8261/g.18464  ORF Transcript_8261/g.18464 Transcript_8261/m.18464 type:complete len:294 (+) Transcript_8261:80-961(+)
MGFPQKQWKRSKKGSEEAPLIEFDPASRHKFIYGFRKRKQARRKEGALQLMERARQEKIAIKKSYRDDVKHRIKELQWATNHIERCLTDESGKARALALEAADGDHEEAFGLENGRADELLEDGDEDDIAPQNSKPEVKKVVQFSREDGDEADDDPFGDCEVTTTSMNVQGPGSLGEIVASGDAWTQQSGGRKPLLTLAVGNEDELALQGMQEKAASLGIDLHEHKRRRKIALIAEEKRRIKAMERQYRKDERLKKVREPKKTPKRKDRIKAEKAGSKKGGGKKGGKKRNKRL